MSPHTFTDARGQEVDVLTTSDLSNATSRALRWLLGTGIAAVVAGTLAWAELNSQVNSIDTRSAANAVNLAEVRILTKKVDSLTVVVGGMAEVLRDLRDQQRRGNPR